MAIEWNKVTWYSKLLAVILFAITFYVGYYLGGERAKVDKAAVINNTPIVENGTYCFNRHQKATNDEPYEVSENIMLKVFGNEVTGVKTGIQQGPDMSNGYEGTLTGTINHTMIEVVYAYTIESWAGKEFEIYTWENGNIIKRRYPLKEQGDMVVPDQTKEASLITYKSTPCVNETNI